MIALRIQDGTAFSLYELTEMRPSYPLEVSKTILVPALSLATVPHDVCLEIDEFVRWGELWLVQRAGDVYKNNLLVNGGPIVPGPISTVVFNLSATPLRLKRGEVVSWVLKVRL